MIPLKTSLCLLLLILQLVELPGQNSNRVAPHLNAIPGKAISPMNGRYIVVRLSGDAFSYSRLSSNLSITVPYQHTTTLARDTFRGYCDFHDVATTYHARISGGFEFQVDWSPAFVAEFSFSVKKSVFGRFNNLNYAKCGMYYNFGVMQEKNVSQFVFRPGVFLVYHEDNYFLGNAPVGYRFAGYDLESEDDSVTIGYAAMTNMLRVNLGVWFLPKYGRTLNVAPWIVIPLISFRLEVGYDFTLWSPQRISIGAGGLYRDIGKQGVSSSVPTGELRKLHFYYGLSVNFGIVIRPYSLSTR